jgi:hypothetical protein
MLWNSHEINGFTIRAEDGTLGTVYDFLFEDRTWLIRWLVVDTSHWLPNRKVLLPTFSLGHPDPRKKEFDVRLTKKQVEESPSTNTDLPVSRQMETHIFENYGWWPYWGVAYIPPSHLPPNGSAALDTESRDGDPHLRSLRQVSGYQIHARDGIVGPVNQFLIGESDWGIHYLLVEPHHGRPDRKVMISPNWIDRVDWIAAEISLTVDRAAVISLPDYTSESLIASGA